MEVNFDIIVLTGFSAQAELHREQLGVNHSLLIAELRKIRLVVLELEKKKNELWDMEQENYDRASHLIRCEMTRREFVQI